VALVVFRLALFLTIQFPAPLGDSVLFASVAHYHCATGRFETPIFPLDPSGAYRYVWHAIGHPALLSWLNPDCSNAGGFFALSVVLASTFALAYLVVARQRGAVAGLLFAAVVFALQAKQGFRPESTAVLLVLGAEWLRHAGKTTPWLLVAGLLAWTQPTTLILYAAFAALSSDAALRQRLATTALQWLPLSIALHLTLWWAYPYPIADLLQGLSAQGRIFAQRDDGSVFNYLVRSDFFPLFGLAFAAVYGGSVWRRWPLLGLLPLLWYVGFRVPATYYNLVPLFVVLLLDLLRARRSETGPAEHGRRMALLCGVALLACAGLIQSTLRDAGSWLQYGSSMASAISHERRLAEQGLVACTVPPWFTLMHPAADFLPSHVPTLRACPTAAESSRRDLVHAVALRRRTDAVACEARAGDPGRAWIPHVFQSDSGYSFSVCPAALPR